MGRNKTAAAYGRGLAVLLLCAVAPAALGALGSAGQSVAPTPVAGAAPTVPVRAVLSAGSSVQPTPQQISQAKAAYAELNSTVKHNIQTLTASARRVENLAHSCTQTPNPHCTLAIQHAASQYENLVSLDSSITSAFWQAASNVAHNSVAEAAPTVSLGGTALAVASSVQRTPQQIAQANAAYAKLNATVKRGLRKLTASYAKLLNQAKSCAQRPTIRCTLAIQLAVKIVATLGNTASRMTQELGNLIQSSLSHPKRGSGSGFPPSARSVSRVPGQQAARL